MEQLLFYQNGESSIVKSREFKNENELQEIVKANPELINLTSIFESPVLIIGRESQHIDILGVTIEAVPVVIECKRNINPDMRYLIAQVFEYASRLQVMNYYEFDNLVTKYLASERCEEDQYRNLSLKEAFKKFWEINADADEVEETFNEDGFVDKLSDNLEDGEFYLVIVVDEISDVASRTIQFLNKKLEKLRIEVIEVSKYGDGKRTIYVPNHTNKEIEATKSQPGKVTFDEMLKECGAKEAEYITKLKNAWEDQTDFSISMGTKGFSARYHDIPILYVFPTYIRIAPKVKKKYKHMFAPTMEILERKFGRDLKVGVTYKSKHFRAEGILPFVNELKQLWLSFTQSGN